VCLWCQEVACPNDRAPVLREQTADQYLTQLKVTTKAIDDAAAGRIEMPMAQRELSDLSAPEEQLRRAFGDEPAVHWVARINRGMLRRAFDIANGNRSGSDVSLDELVSLLDDAGFDAFECERKVAMGHGEPVRVFATDPAYLGMMAERAHLPAPQRERFAEILAAGRSPLEDNAT
jgi:hypothetical protein